MITYKVINKAGEVQAEISGPRSKFTLDTAIGYHSAYAYEDDNSRSKLVIGKTVLIDFDEED